MLLRELSIKFTKFDEFFYLWIWSKIEDVYLEYWKLDHVYIKIKIEEEEKIIQSW